MSYSGMSDLLPRASSSGSNEPAASFEDLLQKAEQNASDWTLHNEDFVLAAKHGSGKVLRLLFNKIFNPISGGNAEASKGFANAADSQGMSALAHAAACGPAGSEAVEILLAHGAAPSIVLPAEKKSSSWSSFSSFFEISEKGKSPLCFAVESNATESIRLLLAADQSLLLRDHCDEHGRRPLAIAAANGFYYAAELLLAAGPNAMPWIPGQDGLCPVEHACSSGSLNILGSLLARDPGLKGQWLRPNGNGDAVLSHAAVHGSPECLAMLVEHASGRPELAAAFGSGPTRTPLLVAAQMSDLKKYQTLLAASSAALSLPEFHAAALPDLSPGASLPDGMAALGSQALWMKSSQEFSMAACKKNQATGGSLTPCPR